MNADGLDARDAEILIVEDSPTQAIRLEHILLQQGYRVRHAPNGQRALEIVEQITPQLVISDVVMPEMDGYELCRRLKAEPRTAEVPVVLVTTLSDPGDVILGLSAGADNFVLKPYDEQHLLSRIQYILVNRRMRHVERSGLAVEIYFNGQHHRITADRLQILNLLLSTYEAAIQRNRELVRAQEALAAAKGEAERANHAKSDFLSRMSHELRTPLNAVLGFAQLMELEARSPEEAENARQILGGGRHLLELINEVLDIASIESGRLPLSLECVPVREVVQEVIALMRPLAAPRHIRITADVPVDGPEHVLADRQRLRQILVNLVGNAVKYNRDGGTIRITCAAEAGGIVRTGIIDDGPGIPPAQIPLLFEPFERLGADRLGIEGTGLGLPLSKGLAEAMGGSLGVTSTVDVGSSFWVDLRRAEPAADCVITETPRPATPHGHGAGTVLYIEDNASNVRLLQRLLARRPGVSLLHAETGEQGLRLAAEARPDLILLDLHLPDVPGEEILRRLAAVSPGRTPPVAVLSADATTGYPRRLVAAGAIAYLTKPLDVRELLQLIDEWLPAADGTDPEVSTR